jgi:hypothetical protein
VGIYGTVPDIKVVATGGVASCDNPRVAPDPNRLAHNKTPLLRAALDRGDYPTIENDLKSRERKYTFGPSFHMDGAGSAEFYGLADAAAIDG